ncbi:unnamed protein product [Caenorhabditis brenneri]
MCFGSKRRNQNRQNESDDGSTNATEMDTFESSAHEVEAQYVETLTFKNPIVAIIGPPLCGKTTLSRKLGAYFGCEILDIASIIKVEIEKQSPIGKNLKNSENSGAAYEDSTINTLIKKRLNQCDLERGVIFDGFPMTQNQLESMIKYLSKKKAEIDMLVCVNGLDLKFVDRRTYKDNNEAMELIGRYYTSYLNGAKIINSASLRMRVFTVIGNRPPPLVFNAVLVELLEITGLNERFANKKFNPKQLDRRGSRVVFDIGNSEVQFPHVLVGGAVLTFAGFALTVIGFAKSGWLSFYPKPEDDTKGYWASLICTYFFCLLFIIGALILFVREIIFSCNCQKVLKR